MDDLTRKCHEMQSLNRDFVQKSLESDFEKAKSHKYIRKEGNKYIYEEPKDNKTYGLYDTINYKGKTYKKQSNGKWLESDKEGGTFLYYQSQLAKHAEITPILSTPEDEYVKRFGQANLDHWNKLLERRNALSDKEHSDEEVGLGKK